MKQTAKPPHNKGLFSHAGCLSNDSFHLDRLALLFLATIIFCNCGGYSVLLPPRLTEDEDKYYDAISCDHPFLIKGHEYPVYSDELHAILKKTKCSGSFFRQLDDLDCDMTIAIIELASRDNPIPILYILTLGIVPHYGTDEYGYVLLITQKNGNESKIDCRRTQKYVMGWIALIYNLSKNWAMTNALHNERYYKRLLIDIDKTANMLERDRNQRH